MKVSELTELIPILEGLRNGRTLQISDPANPNRWEDVGGDKYLELSFPPKHYRLKPEPKLRPWRAEEVPFDHWFRRKSDGWTMRVTGFQPSNGVVCVGGMAGSTLGELQAFFEHSENGRAPWHPCGVMEGAQ